MRHKFLEWIVKNKRATFNSTFRPFQSVELSLHRLLPSRADVRYPQLNKGIKLTQFIEQTLREATQLRNYHEPGLKQFIKVVKTNLANGAGQLTCS